MGGIHYVDAGYTEAIDFAKENVVKVLMIKHGELNSTCR
jgi:hypothetical protein